MDTLKYVKLENPDGSYSSAIPLAIDSDYVDVNGNTLTNKLNDKANVNDISKLQNQINELASGSPLVANSISGMTNTSKIYVNTTDGNWYYYNGSTWTAGGVYQATELQAGSIDEKYIKDNSIVPQKIKDHSILNLFNKYDANRHTNQKLATNGELTSGTNYSTSDYILISPEETYFSTIAMAGNTPAVAFYNKNKNFISYITAPGSWQPVGTFTTPATACYIRVCGGTTGMYGENANAGIYTSTWEPLEYIPYGEFTIDSLKINERNIKNQVITPEKIKGHSIINIFNKNDLNIQINKKIGTNGVLVDGQNYSTTDFISVDDCTTYFSTLNMARNTPAIAFYDKNKNFISYITAPSGWAKIGAFTTPEGTCYIRTSSSTAGAFGPDSFKGIYTSETEPLNYIPYQEFFINGLKINEDNIIKNNNVPVILYVNTTGTDGKMTLKQALESTNTTNQYIIKIDEGIYDILSAYTSTQINNAHYDSTNIRGSFCGPYVDGNIILEGIGRKENTIIKGELSTTTYTTSIREQISTLNLQGNITLKNLTVTAKNIRYPIHDDFTGSANSTITAINCDFIHYLNSTGTEQNNAWGMGCRTGKTTIMEDCYFNPNFYQHTNVSFTAPSRTVLKNCICTRDITVHDKNSGQENIVEIYNTNSPCIVYQWWANTTVDIPTKIICDNEIPIFYLNDSNHLNADIHYIKNDTANIITKGTLIKRNTYNTFNILNDSISILYGIALEDIAVGQYGRCITKGYVSGSDLGITPVLNAKYKIENGNIVSTNENDYIAVCDTSDFIKII